MTTLSDQLLPQTQSVKDAMAFAKQYLDETTYNHVIRSAIFSSIMVRNLKTNDEDNPLADVDLEAVIVSNLLHDMAWNPNLPTTKQFISQDKRFEVDSANTARGFLQQLDRARDWDKHRTQLVWDAIALHATPSIACHKEPEVAISHYGIAIDIYAMPGVPFRGVSPENSVSKNDLDEAYEEFPSFKLAEYLKGAMCALCLQKPETTFDSFVSGYGEEYVEGYTLHGKRVVDFLKAREVKESEEQVLQ